MSDSLLGSEVKKSSAQCEEKQDSLFCCALVQPFSALTFASSLLF